MNNYNFINVYQTFIRSQGAPSLRLNKPQAMGATKPLTVVLEKDEHYHDIDVFLRLQRG